MTVDSKIIFVNTNIVVEELTNFELSVLNNVAQLDMDPRGRIFDYEKVRGLFTENDGLKMHDETKKALAAIVCQRLK